MRDLQRRLGAAGFPPVGAEAGRFCAATADSVREFQAARGLPVSGCCDERTWTALVEANWSLGDRLLVLRSPNLRGDDVADLQARLCRLGFDCGKVDGIFGPLTSSAFERFQRNCGLAADGVCGPASVGLLDRLASQSGSGPGVAMLREDEAFRNSTLSLAQCRIVVGHFGGMGAMVRLIARQLRSAGALVVPVDEPDSRVQATTANHFGADVYLGLEPSDEPLAEVVYYAVPAFESVSGRALAQRLTLALGSHGAMTGAVAVGRRLSILRETKMPATLCRLGPVASALDRSPAIAAAATDAITSWSQLRSLDV